MKKKDIEMENTNDEKPKKPSRRVRTVMTSYQSRVLYDCFQKNPFPSTELREDLSRTLGMKPRTIQIWFQNQRQKTKHRKEHYIQWVYASRAIPYRKLNILASLAVDILYERQLTQSEENIVEE